jgi:hypothetical protein
MWILDYVDEINSDMSVFHGVRNPDELNSAQWFKWAELVTAYEGATRAMVQHDEQEREKQDENAGRADAIKAKMKATQAKHEGSKPTDPVDSIPSITSIMNDPEMLARVRAMATIAREKDGGVANG